ncbi:hypothetical protein BD410DRAFT_787583 [Rickenella mellea]|uniref:Ubiquitin-like domain-containing protein n=1 Tax=Rickenella mellea TaxID=50990 RepID=A0A4Y7Q6R7_9AGAM|nr:hypothetical protein BD410DRAFT_787583 [Rickenella mellea]
MSARPRPRPRPRPAASNSNVAGGSAQVVTSPVQDEDALFMKNKNRTAQSWKALEKRVEVEKAKGAAAGVHDVDWDPDDNLSPKSKKRAGKEKIPAWRQPGVIQALIQSSEDEDDEVVALDETPRAKGSDTTPKGKRKRRSRSRSITPPPPVPSYQLLHARNIVRQALETPRAPSPTLVRDDDTENVELDPELAIIAAAVKKGSSSHLAEQRSTDSSSGPEVEIKYKWIPHPQDASGQEKISVFKMKLTDAFSDLFEEIADEAAVLPNFLIVTYDGKRVFAASTPKSLNIWVAAEFEACTTKTFEYIREHKAEPSHGDADDVILQVDHVSDSEPESEVSEDDDTFRITLRSNGAKEVIVKVRPTTKCEAVVANFLKKNGRKAPKARLRIDGTTADPNSLIGDYDLEDEDMVEVVGL